MHLMKRNDLFAEGPDDSKRPGRPRDPDVDRGILEATQALLIENGYAALSIEGVAAHAGVSRTTVYRRWSSKLQLIAAVLEEVDKAWPIGTPSTGGLRGDLHLLYRDWLRGLSGPGRIIPALIGESIQNKELAKIFRDRFAKPRLSTVRQLFEAAVGNGELPRGTDVATALEMFMGRLWLRALITGEPLTLGDEARVVSMLFEGIQPRVPEKNDGRIRRRPRAR